MKIISIAAVSGGGKTSLTQKLLQVLPNARALYFDEYDFEQKPDDIMKWLHEGADYNEWNLKPMIDDVEQIIHEQIDYLILDYPMSYLNEQMQDYIDLSIFLDTPLDIALARRIIRDFQHKTPDIIDDMRFYLSHARLAYENMLEQVRPNSDVILDGSLPQDEMVEMIVKMICTNEDHSML